MVILSALEIDTKFNVNVLTGSDGVIRGASGGHCDTASSAYSITGKPKEIKFTDKLVAVVRYRDGSVIDTVYQVKE